MSVQQMLKISQELLKTSEENLHQLQFYIVSQVLQKHSYGELSWHGFRFGCQLGEQIFLMKDVGQTFFVYSLPLCSEETTNVLDVICC